MKKLFSLVLVLVMVLSLGVTAFAEEVVPEVFEPELNTQEEPGEELVLMSPQGNKGDKDQSSIKLGKWFRAKYQFVTPAQSFNFKITKHDVFNSSETLASMPMFSPDTFTINTPSGFLGGYGVANLNLPNYTKTGVYQYEVKEEGGNEAGVNYDNRTLILTVYVTHGKHGLIRTATLHELGGKNDMKKIGWLQNDYESSGFYINKKVTGNMGDKNEQFTVIVEFDANGKDVSGQGWYGQGLLGLNPQNFNFVNGKATVTLTVKHGDLILFGNIPFGVSYTVTEADHPDYEEDITNGSGTIKLINKTVYLVNDNEQEIITGINLDNLPYILVLGAATIGLFGFTAKKRFSREDR